MRGMVGWGWNRSGVGGRGVVTSGAVTKGLLKLGTSGSCRTWLRDVGLGQTMSGLVRCCQAIWAAAGHGQVMSESGGFRRVRCGDILRCHKRSPQAGHNQKL